MCELNPKDKGKWPNEQAWVLLPVQTAFQRLKLGVQKRAEIPLTGYLDRKETLHETSLLTSLGRSVHKFNFKTASA